MDLVLGCFLDASKAFDSVDHGILFKKLSNRGLPLAVIRFLLSWYSSQECCVCWGSCCPRSFSFSNGFLQESVLSPLCIWMACCLTLLRVVLGAIGVICLLVVCVMQTTCSMPVCSKSHAEDMR